MAPEQEAGEAVGPPTDIYALGVTLLAALSGRRGPVKVPPPGLDPGLAAIGVAALAREPGERPTAAQMERELRGWLEAARAKARSEARAQRGEALLGAASAKGQAELIELLVRLADRDGRSRARPRASLVSLSSEAAGHVEALLAAGLLSAEEDQLAWSSASLPQEWGRLGAALAAEGPGLSLRERLADALPGADGPPSRAEPPWQGALLAEALAWRARARPLLDAAEAAFLDRSALAERRADRRRMLALVLAVALLSGLGLGFGALWLDTRRAWDQEGQARQAAEGRGLFALGREAEGLRRPHEALAYYLAAADLGAEGAREAAWQVGAAGVASWVVPVARGGVWDVAVDPELGSLFVTAADGKVREIDPATGALQRSFGPPDVELLDVIVRADRLYAYGWPRGVRVWSRAGGEELPRLDAGIRAKGGMRQTPLGPLLTAARDGRLRTWDPETGALLGEAHRGARAFRTALRGDLCAVVDAKKDGGLYRLPDLRSIWEGARVGSAGVAFAGDEALYFDSRGRVTRVNAEGEARESRLLGVPELDGVWSAEEGVVLSSGNGWVGVLDPTAQALDRVLPGGRGTFTDFAFAGDELVGVGDEGGLVWGFSDGRLHARLDGHTGPVKAGAWLPGARRLATVSLDGTARLWDLGDAADGARWLERGGPVRTAWSAGRLNPVTAWCTVGGSCAARDSQGHRWTLPAEAEIIGTGEGWVASYDPAQRRVELFGERGALAQLPVETAPTGAEYQPDVHRLAITYPDGRLDLWDQEPFLASGRRRMSSIGEPSGWHIDLARDRLLVLRHDHTAALYRLSDGAKLADLDPGSASLYSASQWAATSTLGQVLVASSEGGALRFNVEDGRALAPLPDSRRLVSIQVSPDGEVAATTTYDRKVRLWSLRGGDLLFEAGPFDHLLDTALFSPSGRRLAVLDGGGDLRVWDLPTRHLLRHLYVGEGRDRALAFLSEDDLAAGVAGDWSRYHLDNAPADPATLTNFRVCRSTQRVVAVVPFPGAGSPWAPSPDCAGRREVGADGAAGSAETAE
jgi:WD40 repeat protein